MNIDIADSTEILVFTGPESSGKTTCAEQTAQKYQLPRVKEYAREYLTAQGLKYTFKDIQNIAEKQVESEIYANQKHPLIICDTDLVTLEIWALEKFGLSLELNDQLLVKKHYLLCFPDIPWEPDPLRENPDDRKRLFERYEEYLRALDVSFTVLSEDDRKLLKISYHSL